MTTYKEIPNKLRNFEDFKGNSVRAILIAQNTYKVYSYDTLIFEYNYNQSKVEYFDNSYYSNTTSKIQNILIDVFSLNNGKRKRD
jgi:hypothetical protein